MEKDILYAAKVIAYTSLGFQIGKGYCKIKEDRKLNYKTLYDEDGNSAGAMVW